MSVLMHATMSAWQRDHDGSYKAELHGWSLRVRWRPESPGARRGFYWQAERTGSRPLVNPEIHEEIEVAMAHAEQFAAPGDPDRQSETID